MTNNKNKDEEVIDKEEDALEEEELEVNSDIDNLKTRVTELEQHYRRALADYQNLEKRTFEEKREWIRSGNKDLILKLLPVLDILMLAAKHIKDQGLDLSIQQFLDVLETEGVKRIETLGKEFDPHTMECVEIIEGKENSVLEELRVGFTLNEKVVRPAQVKVGKAKN
ncbi:MAG TPA: nucleotide exchange factor GrpE [Candidatus Saccharimonadales bacterium]|nr:nucleotide exchange factor GrpE [Candidatus Saccharimonadales bacterium]